MNEPALPPPAADGVAPTGMRSALDPGDPAARRFPAQALTPSFLPPVAATVIDPDVTVAQLFNHASGPLPLRAELETHGGTLLLFVSGTGRVADFEDGFGYPLGVMVRVNDRPTGQATVLALTPERHGFANLIVINGLDWGRHTLVLESFKGVMAADEADLFNVTVLEI